MPRLQRDLSLLYQMVWWRCGEGAMRAQRKQHLALPALTPARKGDLGAKIQQFCVRKIRVREKFYPMGCAGQDYFSRQP